MNTIALVFFIAGAQYIPQPFRGETELECYPIIFAALPIYHQMTPAGVQHFAGFVLGQIVPEYLQHFLKRQHNDHSLTFCGISITPNMVFCKDAAVPDVHAYSFPHWEGILKNKYKRLVFSKSPTNLLGLVGLLSHNHAAPLVHKFNRMVESISSSISIIVSLIAQIFSFSKMT